ncbi:MAG TPA: histidine kinase [Solirubrobacteraceae bacterium]|nr:histidine kinase [Solirubrobacteraceae bacterium]
MAPRGAHKIFLGMAPGVGKTYQMLEEAHEETERGRDVVIGYLEPHGRAETQEQAAGLETVPRRRLEYHGVTLEEMDLSAILRRRPELCLIDELAHTNVPGSENAKRHEDVEQVLAAGIDVYSTVNVQHVESLAGQIGSYTGAPVRETLPDRVLHEADDVVLVDITPQLLIERLKAGKVYANRSASVAEHGFFRPDTLATLREISLLEVAQEAEPGRQPESGTKPEPEIGGGRAPAARPVLLATHRPAEAPARVLALATPDPWMRATVYHAFRTAERLHAPFDVLWVRSDDGATDDPDEVTALKRLTDTLGGALLIRTSDDLVAATAGVARERGATYLLIGRPRRRTQLGRLVHRDLPLELMSALPEVDVQIVALPDPRPGKPRGGRR